MPDDQADRDAIEQYINEGCPNVGAESYEVLYPPLTQRSQKCESLSPIYLPAPAS